MVRSKSLLTLSCLALLLLATPPSIGSGNSQVQQPDVVWLVPAFVELPAGWTQKPFRTQDSRGVTLSNGTHLMTLDYGFRHGDASGCRSSNLTDAHRLSDLRCGGIHGRSIQLVFVDPLDSSFALLVTIHKTAEDAADQSGQELRILRTLAFVGDLNKLRLIAVDQERHTATVRYENERMRTVRLGDTVSRDFGTLLEVGQSSVLVKTYKLSADGGFEAQTVTLTLS